MQICRYSRRVVPIGFGSSVYVPEPCSTGIQENWQSVCFTRYSQWNAPNQHPYKPDAIFDGTNKLMKRVSLIAVIVEKGRTEERRSQAQNVFMYAFPRYRQEKNPSCMVLSARQQSKVIKMLGPFCFFRQHRSKTVRKRRQNHGYRIDAKSVFAPPGATQPPQIG